MKEEEKDLNMDMFIEVSDEENPLIDIPEEKNDKEKPEEVDLDEDPTDPEKVVEDKNTDPDDETKQNQDEVDDKSSSSSNPELFKSLATLLEEKGLVSLGDFEVKDEDSFVDLFKKQIEKNEYEDLSDTQKEYLKKIRDGIPQEKVEKDLNQINQLNSITEDLLEEDVELRKRVIYQDFINRGYKEEKAKKHLQRSLELDADLEDAKEAIESIKEFTNKRIEQENNQIKQQKLAQEKAREDNIKKITKEIESTKEIIPGYEISENIKSKVKDNMFKVVGDNPNTGTPENSLMRYQRENPIDFDKKLYYLFTITNGFKDFNTIKQESQSKALQDLEKAYRSTTKVNDNGLPSYLQDSESYIVDLGDELVID